MLHLWVENYTKTHLIEINRYKIQTIGKKMLPWNILRGDTFVNKHNNSVDNLKLEMAYVLCDEFRSAQLLMCRPPCLDMFYTHTFQILDFDIRVELSMFFTIVVVVAK